MADTPREVGTAPAGGCGEEVREMPWRTKNGKRYHERYGCSRATIECGTDGLEPCSLCCGKGDATPAAKVAGEAAAKVASRADERIEEKIDQRIDEGSDARPDEAAGAGQSRHGRGAVERPWGDALREAGSDRLGGDAQDVVSRVRRRAERLVLRRLSLGLAAAGIVLLLVGRRKPAALCMGGALGAEALRARGR